MLGVIDPELRRTLLEEIAFQRSERGKFRRLADDEAETFKIQLTARARADACNRVIRALQDVWMANAWSRWNASADELRAEA